jgi:hypothetical protein
VKVTRDHEAINRFLVITNHEAKTGAAAMMNQPFRLFPSV